MVFPNLEQRIQDYLERQRFEQEHYHEVQTERLKTLVEHAYENVALYRNKYDEAGVKPEDIKSVDDIHKLPIVTKDDRLRPITGGNSIWPYPIPFCHLSQSF
jgi:phenylacetate-coenzyme A ligase PaaK-like adenylate-forming protein